MTEITQESLLGSQQFECNIIDDKEDKYDNNIVLIPIQVIIRMSNKVGMDDKN